MAISPSSDTIERPTGVLKWVDNCSRRSRQLAEGIVGVPFRDRTCRGRQRTDRIDSVLMIIARRARFGTAAGLLSLTRTGSNLIPGPCCPSLPAKYWRRAKHLIVVDSMRSCYPRHRRARRQRVSSTTRRFSAMLRRCRSGATEASLLLTMTATCWEVSIFAPSGHLSEMSASREWLPLMPLSRRPQPYAYEAPQAYSVAPSGRAYESLSSSIGGGTALPAASRYAG